MGLFCFLPGWHETSWLDSSRTRLPGSHRRSASAVYNEAVSRRIWPTKNQWALFCFLPGWHKTSRLDSGRTRLPVSHRRSGSAVYNEAVSRRIRPTKNQWAFFVFFQVGMKPAGWRAVVLGFRYLIDGQEALLIVVINVNARFIDIKEQAKDRQRPCLNAGFYDIVGHQVVQLLHDIDKA